MGFLGFGNKVEETGEVVLDYKPSISFGGDIIKKLSEKFKGEVENKTIKFPDELGEEHPFDFKLLGGLYAKYGFFTAVVDKYVDYVVGPGFFVDCKDEKAKKIIEDFMQDVNFDTILRKWIKEALIKGNGFIEIGGDKKEGVKGLKVLNADYMYVLRDYKGKIEQYNQYRGAFNKFSKEKIIDFKPDQIAHVPFNQVGDCAYGLGIGYPALQFMDSQIQQNKDMHIIQNRKANSPLHAKLGKVDGNTKIIPKPSDVTAFGKNMENMHSKTDWATDPLVEFKVIDFGNAGEKFEQSMEHDMNMLIYAFQIPSVLMGTANINEGIAKVQMDGFQRRIQSIQAEVEKIIEQKIFKRVLAANGLEVHVEFEWGAPSTLEVEGRMTLITDLIKSPTTSMTLSKMLEEELVQLLKLDTNEYEKNILEEEKKQEEERKRLEAQPTPIVPGQNKNFPKATPPKAAIAKQPKAEKYFIKKNNIVPVEGEVHLAEFIRKSGKKWLIISHKTGNNLGSFDSKIKAEKALKKMASYVRTKENYEYMKSCPNCNEKWESISDIEEWLGFSYKKYLKYIEKATEAYGFDFLKGVTEAEFDAGYLNEVQISKVRNVLNEGFKKGSSMSVMAKEMDKNVGLKDLYRMEDGKLKTGASGLPILARSAEKRSIGIVRTEVTRLANEGAVSYYKENKIKQVRWVASYGDRTCVECSGLDGQIFEINSYPDIPLHPMCRCTLTPVTELG